MKRTNRQFRIGGVDQYADLDLGCRDGLKFHALVGEGPEHGLGHTRVTAHADADDRDLGHILVNAQLLEAELALGGAHQFSGPGGVATASGLLFITGGGAELFAIDAESGAVLWSFPLGQIGYSNPMVFRATNGRTYVVVATGNGAGAALRAFALPAPR